MHQKARADEHRRHPGPQQVALDHAVPAREEQRGVDGRDRRRQLDDPLDARFCGDVDRARLVVDLPGDVRTGEEEAVAAGERAAHRIGVGQVANGELDAVAEQGGGAVGIADEGPHGVVTLDQLAHDARADVARRSRHQDRHRAPPLLGAMFAFMRKKLSGS
jgi:hypothetical protein